MQFFQIFTGVAAVVSCSANLIQFNGHHKVHHTNKIMGLGQLDSGSKLIGFDQLDAGNKLIGFNSFDTANKVIGLNAFDGRNKMIGLQSFAVPHRMNLGIGRENWGQSGLGTFSLGGVSPLAIDNQALMMNTNAARRIHLMNAAPSIATFGARSLDLAQVAQPALFMTGRSAGDQVIASQSVSADVKPVTAAVATVSRTVDYAPVAYSGEPPKTQVVHVPPNEQGLHINFVSKSSPLTVSQQHIPGEAGQLHVTESEDEPQRLIHNVKKSVVQEVNEVVQPFRVLKTEVKPVIEKAHTLVAEGNKIPLSGRSSGVIATESIVPQTMAIEAMQHHQPTQVVTAQEPRSLNIATIAQPAAEIALAQPRAFNFQPRALEISEFSQPISMAGMGLEKIAIAQPAAIDAGSLMLADANSGLISAKKHMFVHHQAPAMMIQQKWNHHGMQHPLVASGINTQFFHKPATLTTSKIQRF